MVVTSLSIILEMPSLKIFGKIFLLKLRFVCWRMVQSAGRLLTSLIFLGLIYFETFKTIFPPKGQTGDVTVRVRAQDKRKSRLLEISDVVSVNLVTRTRPRGTKMTPLPNIIFMIFYYLESKHFLCG